MLNKVNHGRLASYETACTLKELRRRGFGSLPYLYSEIKAGRLKVHKFGRSTRVLESDLHEWLKALPKGVGSANTLRGGERDYE